jgi:rare lipoprotein A
MAVMLFLVGCAGTPRYAKPGHGVSAGGFRQTGVASYYAHDFHGRKTANGERYNMNDLTAAHLTLPFDTRVRVTNLDTRRSVVVRINDRGPYKGGRIIDLSLGAAKKIGLVKSGTARVRITAID